MLHILCPRIEREERAGDPVAEVGVVLVVSMFWHAAFAGVCRATKAEANTPDVELTRGVGIVRDGVTLGAKEVWPFEYALPFP